MPFKKIKESLDFKQGGNPYTKLDIGPNRSTVWPKSFDNLNDEQKELALNNVRRVKADFVLDDILNQDFLIEPPNEEIENLFGDRFHNSPLININIDDLAFDLDRGFIDLSKIIIDDENAFMTWLGIPPNVQEKVYYELDKYSISFSAIDGDEDILTRTDLDILDKATEKFDDYRSWVLSSLEKQYDYAMSDEGIKEEIESNDYKFNMNGKRVDESLNEFERATNPYNALGIGNRVKLEQWMEDNIPNIEYTVNSNGELELDWWEIRNNNKLLTLPDYAKINLIPHINKSEFNKLVSRQLDVFIDIDSMKKGSKEKFIFKLFYLRDYIYTSRLLDLETSMKQMLKEFDKYLFEDKSIITSVLNNSQYNQFYIMYKKITRSAKQKKEEELFNTYVFIGYEEFKSVTIKGEEYHKKILGIENLYKLDMYDAGSLDAVTGMKLRASTGAGRVYAVKIPKYMADDSNYYNDDINDKLRTYITENKYGI